MPLSENIQLVIQSWRISTSCKDVNHIRSMLPFMIIWFLWKERYECKHNGRKFSSQRVIQRLLFHINAAKHLVWKGDSIAAKVLGVVYNPKPPNTGIHKIVWIKPAHRWKKLNSDGASKGNPGPAGMGGIIRDAEGSVIEGFFLLYWRNNKHGG